MMFWCKAKSKRIYTARFYCSKCTEYNKSGPSEKRIPYPFWSKACWMRMVCSVVTLNDVEHSYKICMNNNNNNNNKTQHTHTTRHKHIHSTYVFIFWQEVFTHTHSHKKTHTRPTNMRGKASKRTNEQQQ